jgi:L-seryl-tRNA(Ser) seleniumtransferase
MAEKLITQPRDLPAVEEVLQNQTIAASVGRLPRPFCVLIVREEIDLTRQKLIEIAKPITRESLIGAIRKRLSSESRRQIIRVINATGILIHTNLGRAPLSENQLNSLKEILTGYSNLEFDLQTGERGSRGESCERYLALLAESESATVVNNCAAALFLMLNTFAARKTVIISRGELVQIGGGFRVPDILRKSGARLVEVGTSNMTSLSDYAAAIDDSTGLMLKVHKSNFAVSGFTEEVSVKELADLGAGRGVKVVHDLGNGLVVPVGDILGYQEATVQQSVRDGAVLTCFSGDKLLGGSQAGVIVGSAESIKALKKNPLFRTVRADKIVFALLEQSCTAYLDNRWKSDIPLWRLITTPLDQLRSRAESIISNIGKPDGVTCVDSEAFMGGGSLPDHPLPSIAIRFDSRRNPRKLIRAFRELTPPVIGRISDDAFFLDLKAVDPSEDQFLTSAIAAVIG